MPRTQRGGAAPQQKRSYVFGQDGPFFVPLGTGVSAVIGSNFGGGNATNAYCTRHGVKVTQ